MFFQFFQICFTCPSGNDSKRRVLEARWKSGRWLAENSIYRVQACKPNWSPLARTLQLQATLAGAVFSSVKTSSGSDKTVTVATSRLISSVAAIVHSAHSLVLPGLLVVFVFCFVLNQHGLLQPFSLAPSSCLCSRKGGRLDAEPIKNFAGQVSKMDERGISNWNLSYPAAVQGYYVGPLKEGYKYTFTQSFLSAASLSFGQCFLDRKNHFKQSHITLYPI